MTPDDLKAWRREMGFSQRRAADELGVDYTTIQRLERAASPSIDRRTALACAALSAGLEEWAPTRKGDVQTPAR